MDMSAASDLHLSADDLSKLEAALQVLLSPLDYDDVDDWRSAVNRHLRELLRADMAMFGLPADNDKLLYYSEEYSPDRLKEYPTVVRPVAEKYSMFETACQMKVFDRDALWHPHLDDYYRSAYYNEYIVPLRGYDMLGMATSATRENTGEPAYAQLLFHHDHPDKPPFGERGLFLLRLLYPAFTAGVGSWLRYGAEHQMLFRCLDQMAEGLLLSDLAGRTVHQNPALTALLQNEPERDRLEAALRRTARSLVQLRRNPGETEPEIFLVPAASRMATQQSAYDISGSYVGGSELNQKNYVLISVNRVGEELPAEELLRERFGLTAQEAKVALFLAGRKTNKEIAEELYISVHTARHHVENVLAKLDIHSRTKVKETILSTTFR